MIPKLKRLEEIIAKDHTLQDVGRELVHLCDSPEIVYDNVWITGGVIHPYKSIIIYF